MTDQIPAEEPSEDEVAALIAVLDPADSSRHSGHLWAGRSLHIAQAQEIANAIIEAGFTRRPTPSEDEREQAERLVGRHLARLSKNDGWDEDDTAIGGQAANIVRQLLEDGLLATRRPMPSREQIARVIYDCDDLERAVLVDAERIADAVLALFKGGDRG